MPILNDIMDHEVFGPDLRMSWETGRAEGQLTTLRGQIEARFGSIPSGLEGRLLAVPRLTYRQ